MNKFQQGAWNRITRGTVFFFSLVAGILALHPGIWNAGWRFDDPQMLEFAANYSIIESFYKPGIWKELGAPFFTPLLTLSYWVDYQIFGLHPWGYYAHQIAVLAVALMLSYKLLEKSINSVPSGKTWAAVGAIFFLSGMPVFVVTEQIMTRHYIEGLCLAILSFQLSQRRSKTALIWSALCYLLAILAKEIYIPLPFFIFYAHWSRHRNIISSINLVAWHGFALSLYALWRIYMLQGIGGYSDQLIPSSTYLLNFLEAGKLISFSDGIFGWILFAIIFGFILQKYARCPWGAIYITAVAAFLILPLFPAIASIPPSTGSAYFIFHRYFFLPWWLLCVALIHAGVSISQDQNLVRLKIQYGPLIVFSTTAIALAILSFHDSTKRPCFEAWAKTSEDVYLAEWHKRPLLGSPPPSEVLPYLQFMGMKITKIKQNGSNLPPDISSDIAPQFSKDLHSLRYQSCQR